MNADLLTDTLGSIASAPHILPALRAVVALVLLFLSGKPPPAPLPLPFPERYFIDQAAGISFSLSFWSIPMLRRCSPSPTQVSQFSVIIEQGNAIMLPASQLLSVSLLSLTLLTASHPDPDIAGLWRWHVVSVLVLVVMGRWEKYAIFPTNDRILAFEHDVGIGEGKVKVTGTGVREFTLEEKKELKGLLDVWAARHPWRIVVTMVCGLITFGVTVSQTG